MNAGVHAHAQTRRAGGSPKPAQAGTSTVFPACARRVSLAPRGEPGAPEAAPGAVQPLPALQERGPFQKSGSCHAHPGARGAPCRRAGAKAGPGTCAGRYAGETRFGRRERG